jgi:hypothetical protein
MKGIKITLHPAFTGRVETRQLQAHKGVASTTPDSKEGELAEAKIGPIQWHSTQ